MGSWSPTLLGIDNEQAFVKRHYPFFLLHALGQATKNELDALRQVLFDCAFSKSYAHNIEANNMYYPVPHLQFHEGERRAIRIQGFAARASMGKKVVTSIRIDQDVLRTAKELGLSVSNVSENALKEAIKRLQTPVPKTEINGGYISGRSAFHKRGGAGNGIRTHAAQRGHRLSRPVCGGTGQPSVVNIPSLLADFRQFLEVDLQRKSLTVKGHLEQIRRFLDGCGEHLEALTVEDIRSYLRRFVDGNSNTYANVLKSLRVFFRDFLRRPDLVESFRFPNREPTVTVVPSRSELQQFYEALTTVRDRALFLMYATSGLRASEVLKLKLSELDFEERFVKPENNKSRTKRTWVSFFNPEAESILKQYLTNRKSSSERLFPISRRWLERVFQNASLKSGINLTPKRLREWFCSEMGKLGVPDRYIDAFCGRIPRSILARHYTDYSPEKLKRIYDKADLKVLAKTHFFSP